MSDSQRSDNPDLPPCTGKFELLSEQEALRILMQPPPPDRFAILSRRGKRLSDTQVLQILQESANTDSSSAASKLPTPLPVAQRAPMPVAPLEYRGLARPARRRPTPSATLPTPYRIFGVAIWAAVALALLLVMILSK